MDIITAVRTRRSIREYQQKPIPREAIEKIIDAARFAPTAKMAEPWEFVIVTKPDILIKIAGLGNNAAFAASAAACIAVFCKDTKYYLEDGCAATQNILLAATSLGIGSCWIAGDKKYYCSHINELLDVPPAFKLVSLVALGYPKSGDCFKVMERRSLNELIHWEKF